MAESLADATGLPLDEARSLLEAAGGNFELAVELHFDGAWTALAVSGEEPPEPPEPIGTTQQRFSVLAVDDEDVEDGPGDSDDDGAIFTLHSAASTAVSGGSGGRSVKALICVLRTYVHAYMYAC